MKKLLLSIALLSSITPGYILTQGEQAQAEATKYKPGQYLNPTDLAEEYGTGGEDVRRYAIGEHVAMKDPRTSRPVCARVTVHGDSIADRPEKSYKAAHVRTHGSNLVLVSGKDLARLKDRQIDSNVNRAAQYIGQQRPVQQPAYAGGRTASRQTKSSRRATSSRSR